MHIVKYLVALILVLPLLTNCNGKKFVCAADGNVEMCYAVSLDTAGRYLEVDLEYRSSKASGDVLLKMPVWAPGYYVIQDFPKHLCDFKVSGSDGKDIGWKKEGKNGWRFSLPSDGKASVSYRIFANELDLASSRVDDKGAFIAPNDVFLYEDGRSNCNLTIAFTVPSNWQNVSTGLRPVSEESYTYKPSSFDILYDSPVLMGNHLVRKFQHDGHEYEMALETPDGYDESGFEDCFRKIVSASTKIMQDVPYDNYTLIHLGKGQGGLEHLNSQVCFTDGTFRFKDRKDWIAYLAFTTHEYFHVYNGKTIRPAELGPFDYDREVFTPLLWFCEGITCYYEALILYRAGLIALNEMLEHISNYLRMDEKSEGHHHQSLRQCSNDIWLDFMNTDANHRDVTVNFYFRGAVVGLIMDIEIKRISQGKNSLDDLMRLLYNRYYKRQDRGFTEDEFWSAVDEVAGSSMSHIRTIVERPVDIDYDKYLNSAGLRLDPQTWTITKLINL